MWTSLPLTAGASSSAGSVMSNVELTAAVLDLGKMVAAIQSYLVSLGMQPTAPVSIHQPWMLPSPSPILSYAMASTMGLVYTMASTLTVTTTVAPVPTTGAVVVPGVPSLQHPFTDGIIHRGAGVQQIQDEGEKSQQIEQPTDKMLRCQVSAVARLQVAARCLLACRRVREMRDLQLIQPDTPSGLHISSKLHFVAWMSSIPSATPGIFCIRFLPWVAGKLFSPRATNSTSALVAVWKALPSLSILSLAGALCLASLFFVAGRHEGTSAGRCCGQFLMVVHVLPFCPDGAHGIQVASHIHVHHAEGARRIFRSHK